MLFFQSFQFSTKIVAPFLCKMFAKIFLNVASRWLSWKAPSCRQVVKSTICSIVPFTWAWVRIPPRYYNLRRNPTFYRFISQLILSNRNIEKIFLWTSRQSFLTARFALRLTAHFYQKTKKLLNLKENVNLLFFLN